MYNLQVRVHLGMEYSIIFDHEPEHQCSDKGRVHLQLLAGIHYNPLQECRSYNPEDDFNKN